MRATQHFGLQGLSFCHSFFSSTPISALPLLRFIKRHFPFFFLSLCVCVCVSSFWLLRTSAFVDGHLVHSWLAFYHFMVFFHFSNSFWWIIRTLLWKGTHFFFLLVLFFFFERGCVYASTTCRWIVFFFFFPFPCSVSLVEYCVFNAGGESEQHLTSVLFFFFAVQLFPCWCVIDTKPTGIRSELRCKQERVLNSPFSFQSTLFFSLFFFYFCF